MSATIACEVVDSMVRFVGWGAAAATGTRGMRMKALASAVCMASAVTAGCMAHGVDETPFERRPDVRLANGSVLRDVIVTISTRDSPLAAGQVILHYSYTTKADGCAEVVSEVDELWATRLRAEAEAAGIVQVAIWPDSPTYTDRDYTREKVSGAWKANYDSECPR